MPVPNEGMSVAYYDDTIYLIGGQYTRNALLKYSLNNNSFTYDENVFPEYLDGWSQWWFQMHNVVYITVDGITMHTYNLVTNQFNSNYATVQYYVGDAGCLTGDESQSLIYYLGGKTMTHLFSYSSNIKFKRYVMGLGARYEEYKSIFFMHCINNNNLYAIGGFEHVLNLNSIEGSRP